MISTLREMAIYFGEAFCGVSFYIGVLKGMENNFQSFYGDGVGSVVALQLALGMSLDQMEKDFKQMAKCMCKKSYFWLGQNYWLNRYIDYLLLDPTVHERIKGRFVCGTTKWFSVHQWHNQWQNNAELGQCIKASCNVPLFCDRGPCIAGCEIVNGSFSVGKLPKDTVVVAINENADFTLTLNVWEMMTPGYNDEWETRGYSLSKQWNGIYKNQERSDSGWLLFVWIGKGMQIFYEQAVKEIDR